MRIRHIEYIGCFSSSVGEVFALINTFFAFSFDRLTSIRFSTPGYFRTAWYCFFSCNADDSDPLGHFANKPEHQLFQFILITSCLALLVSYLTVETLIWLNLLKSEETELLARTGVHYWFSKLLLILSSAFSYFLLFFIWNLIYFVYHYVGKSRKQQLDTLKLESMVKELELQTIKAHINPHFIFNSLNSIRALVDENPERARRAITELSNILRSSMQAEKVGDRDI